MRGSHGITRAWGRRWVLAGGIIILATGWVVSAQSPTPGQAPAPAPGPAGQVEQGRGGGGRGRGGPEVLQGGPQLDDPAYANYDFAKRAPLLPLSPEEQLKKFILQPGYRLELVLADPVIEEPAAITFDGNGRMFVLQIRGYMMDADATGQLDPIGRVSMHVDTNNDGVYDKHTVFADKLVFPRFATPFGKDTLLIKESNAQELWKFTDTNGDGVADKKELFDTGYGRLGNVEHQESHLTWGLDNWMYSTFNAFRVRWTPHGVMQGADRRRRRTVGRRSGRRREDLVPGRRERAARVLAVTGVVRQLRRRPRRRSRWRASHGSRSRHSVGRARAHCRHAGRPRRDAHARRFVAQHDGRLWRRHRACPSHARRPAG